MRTVLWFSRILLIVSHRGIIKSPDYFSAEWNVRNFVGQSKGAVMEHRMSDPPSKSLEKHLFRACSQSGKHWKSFKKSYSLGIGWQKKFPDNMFSNHSDISVLWQESQKFCQKGLMGIKKSKLQSDTQNCVSCLNVVEEIRLSGILVSKKSFAHGTSGASISNARTQNSNNVHQIYFNKPAYRA